MYNPFEVPFAESFSISLMGFSTVFLVLVSLAVTIIIVSMILRLIGINSPKKNITTTAPAANKPIDNQDSEIAAAVIAAVSSEIDLPLEEFNVVSITERK